MKNCHVRFILTVDNEKSLCEKKKSPFEIIDCFFSELVRHNQSAESILVRFSLILKMAEQLRALRSREPSRICTRLKIALQKNRKKDAY